MTYPVPPDGPRERDSMVETSAADAASRVLHFPDGIPGFPDHQRFVLVSESGDAAFQLLQSVDDPDMAMYVCVPWLFFPGYAPELSSAEQDDLAIERPEDALVFCPVTIDLEAKRVYVNLLGPFVVNADSRRGRQLVLAGSDYTAREPVQLSPE